MLLPKIKITRSLLLSYKKYDLQFKQPAGTSRGVLKTKPGWFLYLTYKDDVHKKNAKTGIGECSLIPNLSIDNPLHVESKLEQIKQSIDNHTGILNDLTIEFPAIKFALETALLDLQSKQAGILFPSRFTRAEEYIPINGLIWMGEPDFMKEQIREKLDKGFHCLKLKIGALDFEKELEILSVVRQEFSADKLEIRVDANGAFTKENAEKKLERLSEFQIESIEQPVKAGQYELIKNLCRDTSIPIALDEDLIGITGKKKKRELLIKINPQYIVLKPSLLGGFTETLEWIELAEEQNVKYWITSALESNIALSVLAQWTWKLLNSKELNMEKRAQGLGTGQLFTNNVDSPLCLKGDKLFYQAF